MSINLRQLVIEELRPLIIATILLMLITAVAYPLAVTGVGQALFHHQANGSLISANGKSIGSSLIGQQFTGETYFHGRPSSAGNGYDASNSSGSNLGPTSRTLITDIKQRVAAFIKENGLPANTKVPADAVTASASGLDPDVSPATALLQVNRVAKARGAKPSVIRQLVNEYTSGTSLGFIGQPRVNVLELNIALDQRFPVQSQ